MSKKRQVGSHQCQVASFFSIKGQRPCDSVQFETKSYPFRIIQGLRHLGQVQRGNFRINWELGLGMPHQDPHLRLMDFTKVLKSVMRLLLFGQNLIENVSENASDWSYLCDLS